MRGGNYKCCSSCFFKSYLQFMKLFYQNCKNLDMQNVERLCCITKHGFLDVVGPNEFWRKTILDHNANQLACETCWEASFTDAAVVTVSICCYMLQILARVLDTATSAEILQCKISVMSRKSNTRCGNTYCDSSIWGAETRTWVGSQPERHRESFQM